MKDVHHLSAYEHPNGRIYCCTGGLTIGPMWLLKSYIQWDEEHGKYGLYRYLVASHDNPEAPTHDRVGAEPSFEAALDWLLGTLSSL